MRRGPSLERDPVTSLFRDNTGAAQIPQKDLKAVRIQQPVRAVPVSNRSGFAVCSAKGFAFSRQNRQFGT
jgi:hypothetical protein